MPIYEYQCGTCGHEFETMQKVSEDPLRDCPACGRSDLTKLVSAAGFRLKGGGWYETDFKSGGEKKRNLAGGAEAAGGESKAADKGASAAEKPANSSSEKTPTAAT